MPQKSEKGFWKKVIVAQLVGVIFCLISSVQLNLEDNYYFQEKLDMFTYK